MLIKGFVGYLASIMDTMIKLVTEQLDVCVVCRFLDMFPKEWLGLTPGQEIEIKIELFPRIAPISKVPYRMTPAELKELK